MSTFQKIQAAKILSAYGNPADIEKGSPEFPVGYINEYGYQKQPDGSWEYKEGYGPKKSKKKEGEPEKAPGAKPNGQAKKAKVKVSGSLKNAIGEYANLVPEEGEKPKYKNLNAYIQGAHPGLVKEWKGLMGKIDNGELEGFSTGEDGSISYSYMDRNDVKKTAFERASATAKALSRSLAV